MFQNILNDFEKSQLLTETDSHILFYLNEERGIASEIQNVLMTIRLKTDEEVKNTQSLPYNKDFITYKKGKYELKVFNKNITFEWEYYSFVNETLKNSIHVADTTGYLKKITNNDYVLHYIVKAVQGKIDYSRTLEVIQHELEHLWETLNFGKSYSDENVYAFAQKLMNDTVNPYNNAIGLILYLSRKWEQRAYANGVYSYLMNHQVRNLTRVNLKDTQLYRGLIQLKEAVNLIKSIASNWQQHSYVKTTLMLLNNQYKISYNKLIQIGEQSIEHITKILGRTLSKVEDDIKKETNESTMFPYITF